MHRNVVSPELDLELALLKSETLNKVLKSHVINWTTFRRAHTEQNDYVQDEFVSLFRQNSD
jgi:hypothetical protein